MKTKNPYKTPLFTRLVIYFILLIMLSAGLSVYYSANLPEKYYTFASDIDSFTVDSTYPLTTKFCERDGSYSVDFRLMGFIPVRSVSVEVLSEMSLMAGGQSFGIKMFCDGLIVVGFSPVETADGEQSPAFAGGVRAGDIILSANGERDLTNESFSRIVRESGGGKVNLEVKRRDVTVTLDITPAKSVNGDFLLGCFVRDSTAGIGTLTFADPVNGTFGGLGHGVYDSDTGSLMPLRGGNVVGSDIYSVVRGEAGAPGELRGIFNETRQIGDLFANTEEGIFGMLSQSFTPSGDIYPVGLSGEVKEGEATILSTVDDNGVCEYTINIDKILRSGHGTVKNFVITVTDEALIEKTGGIVQGMSGSPIIQNGKLVGAVTHVMIGDARKGYGIFIENMLSAMKNNVGNGLTRS